MDTNLVSNLESNMDSNLESKWSRIWIQIWIYIRTQTQFEFRKPNLSYATFVGQIEGAGVIGLPQGMAQKTTFRRCRCWGTPPIP